MPQAHISIHLDAYLTCIIDDRPWILVNILLFFTVNGPLTDDDSCQ
jgi:hypothetical protein